MFILSECEMRQFSVDSQRADVRSSRVPEEKGMREKSEEEEEEEEAAPSAEASCSRLHSCTCSTSLRTRPLLAPISSPVWQKRPTGVSLERCYYSLAPLAEAPNI